MDYKEIVAKIEEEFSPQTCKVLYRSKLEEWNGEGPVNFIERKHQEDIVVCIFFKDKTRVSENIRFIIAYHKNYKMDVPTRASRLRPYPIVDVQEALETKFGFKDLNQLLNEFCGRFGLKRKNPK